MKGVAAVLGLPQSRCTVRCRRMGGAFGGKTTRSVVPATAVALAANKLGRQVRCTGWLFSCWAAAFVWVQVDISLCVYAHTYMYIYLSM